MESLADFLGVRDPRPEPAPPGVEPSVDLSDPKVFCQKVLNSSEFRQYITNGIVIGDLPPVILCRLMDHGWGKPVERVEVQAIQALDGLSPAELRAHLQERIQSLAVMVSLLDEDCGRRDADTAESVH